MKKLLALALLLGVPTLAFAEPVTLNADVIDYNLKTGHAVLQGHVVISGQGLILKAPRGEARREDSFVNLTGGVTLDGLYEGVPVALQADSLQGTLAGEKNVTLSGSVKARQGERALDCEKLQYSAPAFTAWKVTEARESDKGWVFVCDRLTGTMGDEGVQTVQARGHVQAKNRADGSQLTADAIDYDKPSGRLIARGNARASSGERVISADTIVYNLTKGTISTRGRSSAQFEDVRPGR